MKIYFEAKLSKIGSWTILRVPKGASEKLPSRGMVMVEGTINNFPFKRELEPDGKKGHFLKLDEAMRKGAKANAGDTVRLEFEISKEWPDPKVPEDLKKALSSDPKARALWEDITPMARWDWIRWIGATKNPDTRAHHIVVALSKLNKGMRRPCCFNRAACTIPDVSHNGVLLD
jgi:hypothetical protein